MQNWKNLENQLLLISINFTPKTSHSCLKKWYTRFSRKDLFSEKLEAGSSQGWRGFHCIPWSDKPVWRSLLGVRWSISDKPTADPGIPKNSSSVPLRSLLYDYEFLMVEAGAEKMCIL